MDILNYRRVLGRLVLKNCIHQYLNLLWGSRQLALGLKYLEIGEHPCLTQDSRLKWLYRSLKCLQRSLDMQSWHLKKILVRDRLLVPLAICRGVRLWQKRNCRDSLLCRRLISLDHNHRQILLRQRKGRGNLLVVLVRSSLDLTDKGMCSQAGILMIRYLVRFKN